MKRRHRGENFRFSICKAGLSREKLLMTEAELCNPFLRNHWVEFAIRDGRSTDEYDSIPLLGELARYVITVAERYTTKSDPKEVIWGQKELLFEI